MTTPEDIAAQCLAMRVRKLARGLTRAYDDALRPHGLNSARLNLLVAIATHPGVQAHELVQPLDIEKSTLSRNLAKLLADGLIRAERSPRALYLTAAGEQLLTRATPAWEDVQERVHAQLGPLADALLQV